MKDYTREVPTRERLFRFSGMKTYNGRFTFGPVDLGFPVGITCILGANGAGKSTLFRMLAGFEKPTQGKVYNVDNSFRMGYLPQEYDLPTKATVQQYLEHVSWLYGITRSARSQAIEDALTAVDLTERRGDQIGKLSGGMRRRLGYAHAIVHNPDILLLDEPTVGLDPIQRLGMRSAIKKTTADRVTLVSTHLLDDFHDLAASALIINEGQVVFFGSRDELDKHLAELNQIGLDRDEALASMMAGSSLVAKGVETQ